MPRSMFKALIILAILLLFGVGSSYADGPFTKLGRGLINMGTGWIEIFTTVEKSCEKHYYISGFFYGLPTGIAKALIRTVVGAYEIVTFPLPFPNDYESIIEPEFIMQSHVQQMREH